MTMDLNISQNSCRKGYFSVKLTSLFRPNEQSSRLSLLTVQFFLTVPIRLPISRVLPNLAYRQRQPLQMESPSPEQASAQTGTRSSFDTFLMERAQIAENRLCAALDGLLDSLNAHQLIGQLKLLAAERPLMLICLALLGAATAFPLLSFIFFAAVSMILTVLGFVFFQGTLLMIATVLTGGLLMMGACAALPVAVFLAAVYLSTSFVAQALNSAVKLGKRVALSGQNETVISERISRPARSLVPACVLQSDVILSKRLAANRCSRISKTDVSQDKNSDLLGTNDNAERG